MEILISITVKYLSATSTFRVENGRMNAKVYTVSTRWRMRPQFYLSIGH